MDAGAFIELGSKIVKVGQELKNLRDQRDALNPQIAALEAELTPLLMEHAKMIASVAGVSMPTLAPTAAVVEAPGVISHPVAGTGVNAQLKARVVDYLKKRQGEEGVSAMDVADVLKIDAAIVREAMMELRNAR